MRQKYLFQSFKLIYLLHYYNFWDSHLNIVKILEIILILLPPPWFFFVAGEWIFRMSYMTSFKFIKERDWNLKKEIRVFIPILFLCNWAQKLFNGFFFLLTLSTMLTVVCCIPKLSYPVWWIIWLSLEMTSSPPLNDKYNSSKFPQKCVSMHQKSKITPTQSHKNG